MSRRHWTVRNGLIATTTGLALVMPLTATQAPQQAPPVFSANAPGVEVDVRVFGRDGEFLTTLGRDDFEILEDGVPQTITTVTLVGGQRDTDGQAPVPVGSATTLLSAVPGTDVNTRQAWIFMFDLNHLTPGGGFDRARAAVKTFLEKDFKEGDIGGVLAGSQMVNNRLTSERKELVAAVDTVKPRSDQRSRQIELTREWPRLRDESEALLIASGNRDALQRAVIRACTDDPTACQVATPDALILEKAQRTQRDAARASLDSLNALNALASGLARMPGPKTVVLLTDGFVTADLETTLRTVVGQTTRAGARVYAIDVRGLNRGAAAGIGDQMSPDDPAGGPARFEMGEDGPNSLAIDTGGMFIRNENNIGRALADIAQDANTYYVIGYQPANTNFDGKYRAIDVRVTGERDVKVRARRGYLALPPAQMLTPRPIIRADPTDEPVTPPVPAAPTAPPPPAPPASAPLTLPSPTSSAASPSPSSSPEALRLRPGREAAVLALAGDDLTSPADTLAAEGWAAYQRGDVEAAIGPLTRAAARPQVRPWALYVLGMSHAALGASSQAVEAWERVRKAAPDFSPVYLDLASTYGALDDLTRALAVLRDGAGRWPDDPEMQNAIGVVLVRRGALDDAISSFEHAMLAAPEDPVAYLNLGRTHEMRYLRSRRYIANQQRWVAPDGDRQRALEYFQRYIDLEGPYRDQAVAAVARLQWSGK